MERHDRDRVEVLVLLGIHDERDVLKEAAHAVELLHRADQFLQVVETTRCFR
ncbi:hypothetical protein D3C87_1937380 [compost metagenome]